MWPHQRVVLLFLVFLYSIFLQLVAAATSSTWITRVLFFFVDVWLCFHPFFFFFSPCPPHFRRAVKAARFHAVYLCLFSERWRERRTPPICGSSGGRGRLVGELWLLEQEVGGGGGGGRGRYKNPLRHSESLTLEEESEQGGSVNVAPKDPPSNPLYLLVTGVCFPALNRPGTRTLTKTTTSLYLV